MKLLFLVFVITVLINTLFAFEVARNLFSKIVVMSHLNLPQVGVLRLHRALVLLDVPVALCDPLPQSVDDVLQPGDLTLLLRLDQHDLLLVLPQHVDLVVEPLLVQLKSCIFQCWILIIHESFNVLTLLYVALMYLKVIAKNSTNSSFSITYLLHRVQVLDLVRHDLDALLEGYLGVEEGLRVAQDHVVQFPLVVAEYGEPLLHLHFCGTELPIQIPNSSG